LYPDCRNIGAGDVKLRLLILFVVAYACLVFWLPSQTNTFRCSGSLLNSDGSDANPTEYSAMVVRYQPWIFWAKDKGSVITENNFGFKFYNAATFTSLEAYFESEGNHKSYFSLVSHRIVLYFKDGREFRGLCERT